MRKLPAATAFSLVEVTLALGIAAFCLIAVFGIMPVGVQTNRNATSQTAATNIMAAVIADLRATPTLQYDFDTIWNNDSQATTLRRESRLPAVCRLLDCSNAIIILQSFWASGHCCGCRLSSNTDPCAEPNCNKHGRRDILLT